MNSQSVTAITTLQSHVLERHEQHPDTTGTLSWILSALSISAKIIADIFVERERVLAMSILINSWPIGIGLSLLLSGSIAEAIGWPAAIVASALFSALGLVTVALLLKSAPPAAATLGGVGLSAISAVEWRLLAIASLPWFLYNAAYQIVVSFLPALFLEHGMSIGRAGSIAGINALVMVVSVQTGGILLKRVPRPDLVCVVAIVTWCATLAMLTTGWMPMLWVVVGGLIFGLPASAFVTIPSEFLRPESRAAGMGVFYTVYYLGCALTPGVAGALFDATHSASSTLWLAAAMGIGSIVALGGFRSLRRRLDPGGRE